MLSNPAGIDPSARGSRTAPVLCCVRLALPIALDRRATIVAEVGDRARLDHEPPTGLCFTARSRRVWPPSQAIDGGAPASTPITRNAGSMGHGCAGAQQGRGRRCQPDGGTTPRCGCRTADRGFAARSPFHPHDDPSTTLGFVAVPKEQCNPVPAVAAAGAAVRPNRASTGDRSPTRSSAFGSCRQAYVVDHHRALMAVPVAAACSTWCDAPFGVRSSSWLHPLRKRECLGRVIRHFLYGEDVTRPARRVDRPA